MGRLTRRGLVVISCACDTQQFVHMSDNAQVRVNVEFSAQWNRAAEDPTFEGEIAEDGRQLKLFDCLLVV